MSAIQQGIKTTSEAIARLEAASVAGLWVASFNGCSVYQAATERQIKSICPKGQGWAIHFESAK